MSALFFVLRPGNTLLFLIRYASVEIVSGEEHLQHALVLFNIQKKKRLLKLLKAMANEEDMLLILPMKL